MGCCLTKNSRENRANRKNNAQISEPLVTNKNAILTPSLDGGLSLTGEISVNLSAAAYSPPVLVSLTDEEDKKLINGTSLLRIPHIDNLTRTGWAYKRGHMVCII